MIKSTLTLGFGKLFGQGSLAKTTSTTIKSLRQCATCVALESCII